jgi:quinol-cytochrome oxidoreductase complex cytochrome b subunit
MKDFKSAAHRIGFHAMIMLRGFLKVLYGAVVAGLIGLSVYGFQAIPTEGGYAAVGDFVGAVAIMCVAFGGMYFIGCKKKRGGYEK